MKEIAIENRRPQIPGDLLPDAARLIRECWRRNPWKHTSVAAILRRLDKMDIKIARAVLKDRSS
jgi:hypothetical protein